MTYKDRLFYVSSLPCITHMNASCHTRTETYPTTISSHTQHTYECVMSHTHTDLPYDNLTTILGDSTVNSKLDAMHKKAQDTRLAEEKEFEKNCLGLKTPTEVAELKQVQECVSLCSVLLQCIGVLQRVVAVEKSSAS